MVDEKSFAAEIFEYNRPLKALGMGGAYLFNVEPQDAPLLNQAELAFLKEIHWEFFNVGLGVNGIDAYNSSQNFHAIASASDYSQFYGKRIWVDAFGRTSFVMPNFGLVAYGDLKSSFNLHNPAFPQFEVTYLNDYGFDIAGANMIGSNLSFGYGLRRVYRTGGTQNVGLDVIASGSTTAITDNFKNSGIGFGVDASIEARMPGSFAPRFVVAWTDIGDTRFSKTGGSEAPPAIENNLSVGVGSVLDFPGLDMSAGMEINHIMNSAYSFAQKLHFGTELSLPLIDIRAGLSQGYPSYGIGFNLYFMKFDVAYYFTELGAYTGQTPENRIQLGLSFDLSLDADFSITSKDGKKRKLKQRR